VSAKTGKTAFAVAAIVTTVVAVGYLAFGGIEENLVYYWTPSDLIAKGDTVKGATIRLGGMVQEGTMDWDDQTLRLRFSMAEGPDPDDDSIAVVATGAPPQMFREGIGCVVEGTYDGQLFHSDRLMVKHSNEYQPPAEGEEAKEKYKTLVAEPGGSGGASL
jgi:cytochrome c-type biogenesis protein CcmE